MIISIICNLFCLWLENASSQLKKVYFGVMLLLYSISKIIHTDIKFCEVFAWNIFISNLKTITSLQTKQQSLKLTISKNILLPHLQSWLIFLYGEGNTVYSRHASRFPSILNWRCWRRPIWFGRRRSVGSPLVGGLPWSGDLRRTPPFATVSTRGSCWLVTAALCLLRIWLR